MRVVTLTEDQLEELVARAVASTTGAALPQGNTPTKDNSVYNATMASPSQATPSSSIIVQLAEIINTFDELRRSLARSPKWVDIDDAVTLYGVPAKTIKVWASQGLVRRSKLGPSFQSKALYNAEDLNDVLCRIAAGKPAVNALRKEA